VQENSRLNYFYLNNSENRFKKFKMLVIETLAWLAVPEG
jgi:hypothetical protein